MMIVTTPHHEGELEVQDRVGEVERAPTRLRDAGTTACASEFLARHNTAPVRVDVTARAVSTLPTNVYRRLK